VTAAAFAASTQTLAVVLVSSCCWPSRCNASSGLLLLPLECQQLAQEGNRISPLLAVLLGPNVGVGHKGVLLLLLLLCCAMLCYAVLVLEHHLLWGGPCRGCCCQPQVAHYSHCCKCCRQCCRQCCCLG